MRLGIPAWAAGRRWNGCRTGTRKRNPQTRQSQRNSTSYNFADRKKRVIHLLQRVCTVSVKTVRIVSELERMSEIATDETAW